MRKVNAPATDSLHALPDTYQSHNMYYIRAIHQSMYFTYTSTHILHSCRYRWLEDKRGWINSKTLVIHAKMRENLVCWFWYNCADRKLTSNAHYKTNTYAMKHTHTHTREFLSQYTLLSIYLEQHGGCFCALLCVAHVLCVVCMPLEFLFHLTGEKLTP